MWKMLPRLRSSVHQEGGPGRSPLDNTVLSLGVFPRAGCCILELGLASGPTAAFYWPVSDFKMDILVNPFFHHMLK